VGETAICDAPGTPLFVETFENDPFDYLPAVNGDASWTRVASGTHPATLPYAGSYMAEFDSYSSMEGSAELESGTWDLSGTTSVMLVVHMSHDTGMASYDDTIQVQYDIGSGWVDFGAALHRNDGTTGWAQHSFDMSAVLAGQAARVRLHAVSDWGNDMFVDQVLFMAD
jgi:hypothetical protein